MTTIEVGKFYKNTCGQKVEVLQFFQRDNKQCLVGIYTDKSGCPRGSWDLVDHASNHWTPWIDEPAIPWDSVPEWCQWWAVDVDGGQWFYGSKPEVGGVHWVRSSMESGAIHIPKHLETLYTGDWRESLQQRPGKEVKP
jgi:hypothetical protein